MAGIIILSIFYSIIGSGLFEAVYNGDKDFEIKTWKDKLGALLFFLFWPICILIIILLFLFNPIVRIIFGFNMFDQRNNWRK